MGREWCFTVREIVSHPRFSGFSGKVGLWDRQIRFRIYRAFSRRHIGSRDAINDNGQIVGISGICDQAVGRHTAKHAVLWENGSVIDLGNLGAQWWNTPTAINHRGDIVGFAGDPAFVEGDILHAFMWTREDGIRHLKPLKHHTPEHVDSEAYGVNERRQVVGVSCDAVFVDCRAVIWDHGNTPTDLNDLKGGFSARLETREGYQ